MENRNMYVKLIVNKYLFLKVQINFDFQSNNIPDTSARIYKISYEATQQPDYPLNNSQHDIRPDLIKITNNMGHQKNVIWNMKAKYSSKSLTLS